MWCAILVTKPVKVPGEEKMGMRITKNQIEWSLKCAKISTGDLTSEGGDLEGTRNCLGGRKNPRKRWICYRAGARVMSRSRQTPEYDQYLLLRTAVQQLLQAEWAEEAYSVCVVPKVFVPVGALARVPMAKVAVCFFVASAGQKLGAHPTKTVCRICS